MSMQYVGKIFLFYLLLLTILEATYDDKNEEKLDGLALVNKILFEMEKSRIDEIQEDLDKYIKEVSAPNQLIHMINGDDFLQINPYKGPNVLGNYLSKLHGDHIRSDLYRDSHFARTFRNLSPTWQALKKKSKLSKSIWSLIRLYIGHEQIIKIFYDLCLSKKSIEVCPFEKNLPVFTGGIPLDEICRWGKERRSFYSQQKRNMRCQFKILYVLHHQNKGIFKVIKNLIQKDWTFDSDNHMVTCYHDFGLPKIGSNEQFLKTIDDSLERNFKRFSIKLVSFDGCFYTLQIQTKPVSLPHSNTKSW
jgi:hypothetical protein